MLTQDDRALITALQIAPRASWSDVGTALGISGVTAARRWRRIAADGTAWITAAPGIARRVEQCVAYVEIDCVPAQRLAVATRLAQHEFVVTVEITTGSADILVTVGAADLATLSHYLLDHMGATEHVLRTRVRMATKAYTEGSSWRLTELDRSAVQTLERSRPDGEAVDGDPGGVELTPAMQQIARLLSVDGRASYAELAADSGMSPTTVRRIVSRLLGAGLVLPRTDVAAELSGTPVQVYLWGDAPVRELPRTAGTLAQLRQVRLCATVSSAPSLVVCAWLHTVEEVHRLELTIANQLPDLRILDRLIVLRTVKRMGRLVDPQGRAVGVVPISLWEDRPHSMASAAPARSHAEGL